MRSEKQRQASRANGKKSKGPITPEGKDKVKLNGLKHGLRAAQVVLPGEDPAEFEAELEGWAGDWKPTGHTRAVLVERAAVASWRLRRCVRAEADLLLEIAAAAAERRDDDDDEPDDGPMDRIDDADDYLPFDPSRRLAELKSMPGGVDRLIWRWGKLDEALDDGWDLDAHTDLLPLLGHRFDSDPAAAGPLAEASHRLALDGRRRDGEEGDGPAAPMTDAEVDEAVAGLRRRAARELKALRALREDLAAPPARPEAAAAAKFVGVTPELMLLHRYEMAHERSLRAAIKDLVALEKARPGLGAAGADATEVVTAAKVTTKPPESPPRPAAKAGPASGGPGPGASAAPSEPEPEAAPSASGKAWRDREGRAWGVGGAGGGASAS